MRRERVERVGYEGGGGSCVKEAGSRMCVCVVYLGA